jgi:hypothetical protein
MRIAIAVSVLLLIGCEGGTTFDKPGGSPERVRLDLHDCEQVAAKGEIQALSSAERAQQKQMETDDCMTARGYKRVPKAWLGGS